MLGKQISWIGGGGGEEGTSRNNALTPGTASIRRSPGPAPSLPVSFPLPPWQLCPQVTRGQIPGKKRVIILVNWKPAFFPFGPQVSLSPGPKVSDPLVCSWVPVSFPAQVAFLCQDQQVPWQEGGAGGRASSPPDANFLIPKCPPDLSSVKPQVMPGHPLETHGFSSTAGTLNTTSASWCW